MTTEQARHLTTSSTVEYAGHTWDVSAIRGKGMCPPYLDLVRYDENGQRRVELGVSYRIVGHAQKTPDA